MVDAAQDGRGNAVIETGTLLHYPSIAMSRFGTIDVGSGVQNRYRLIWAPSRMITLVPKHRTPMTVRVYGGGSSGVPRSLRVLNYRMDADGQQGDCWLLEQWKAPWDYYEGTKEQWERDPLKLDMGPYPSKGEYDSDASSMIVRGTPSLELVEKIILLIEDGWKRHRPAENNSAIGREVDRGLKERDDRMDDRIRNRSLIGSGEAWSSPGGGGRGTKTIQTEVTAQEAGLPGIPGATTMSKKRYPQYDLTKHVR